MAKKRNIKQKSSGSYSKAANELCRIYEDKGWESNEFFICLDGFIRFLIGRHAFNIQEDDKNDLIQQCNERIFSRAMHKYDESRELLNFLYKVIQNEILSFNNRAKRRLNQESYYEDMISSDPDEKNSTDNYLIDDKSRELPGDLPLAGTGTSNKEQTVQLTDTFHRRYRRFQLGWGLAFKQAEEYLTGVNESPFVRDYLWDELCHQMINRTSVTSHSQSALMR